MSKISDIQYLMHNLNPRFSHRARGILHDYFSRLEIAGYLVERPCFWAKPGSQIIGQAESDVDVLSEREITSLDDLIARLEDQTKIGLAESGYDLIAINRRRKFVSPQDLEKNFDPVQNLAFFPEDEARALLRGVKVRPLKRGDTYTAVVREGNFDSVTKLTVESDWALLERKGEKTLLNPLEYALLFGNLLGNFMPEEHMLVRARRNPEAEAQPFVHFDATAFFSLTGRSFDTPRGAILVRQPHSPAGYRLIPVHMAHTLFEEGAAPPQRPLVADDKIKLFPEKRGGQAPGVS